MLCSEKLLFKPVSNDATLFVVKRPIWDMDLPAEGQVQSGNSRFEMREHMYGAQDTAPIMHVSQTCITFVIGRCMGRQGEESPTIALLNAAWSISIFIWSVLYANF